MTARIQEKTVSAYFYYMWNAWSKEECDTVFGSQSRHFWEKWDYLYRTFHGSAAEHFYAALSAANRRLVVERACKLYDGNRLRDNPKYVGKTVEKTPERLVLVVDNAPQSLANLFMAGDIPFAYSSGRFIVFDNTTPPVLREYLERRGIPHEQLDRMSFSQREIGINDIPLP